MFMENLHFYTSLLDGPALGGLIFTGFYLYKKHKHYSTLMVAFGFLVITIGVFANGYCLSIAQVPRAILDHPYLCHYSTSYIKGTGYILVALGLLKFIEYLKSA